MLEAQNLTKEFGSLKANDDISFSLGETSDEIVFIVGPNGAGKTTLLNLMTGYFQPTSGQILDNGEDITSLEPVDRVHRGIVRSFQIVHLFEEMDVRDNIRICSLSNNNSTGSVLTRNTEYEAVENHIDEILDIFSMEDIADQPVSQLPHGQKKLLDVAMTFGLNPEYLLLDEPTAGVPMGEKEPLMKTIVDVSKSKDVPTLIVEHDMDLVTNYADRVIALHQGSVFSEGDPKIIEEDASLRKTLLGITE